jgi:hypothetical protein
MLSKKLTIDGFDFKELEIEAETLSGPTMNNGLRVSWLGGPKKEQEVVNHQIWPPTK